MENGRIPGDLKKAKKYKDHFTEDGMSWSRTQYSEISPQTSSCTRAMQVQRLPLMEDYFNESGI